MNNGNTQKASEFYSRCCPSTNFYSTRSHVFFSIHTHSLMHTFTFTHTNIITHSDKRHRHTNWIRWIFVRTRIFGMSVRRSVCYAYYFMLIQRAHTHSHTQNFGHEYQNGCRQRFQIILISTMCKSNENKGKIKIKMKSKLKKEKHSTCSDLVSRSNRGKFLLGMMKKRAGVVFLLDYQISISTNI